jgi:hypothetical protein
MNCGSVDSLKVSTWWGSRSNALQIRPTVDSDRPVVGVGRGEDQDPGRDPVTAEDRHGRSEPGRLGDRGGPVGDLCHAGVSQGVGQ